VQLPCRENAQECIKTPEQPDAMLVNSRKGKVGITAAPMLPGQKLNGPRLEQNVLWGGIYSKAGRVRAPTNENLICGEIWDRQENLEFKR
jgi:hypothetical protein